MTSHPYSLGRQKKLKSSRDIEQLFKTGAHVFHHPLKLMYQALPADTHAMKIAFAVSKKALRRAHERNRCKRLLREAFRLQQGQLQYPGALHLICIYIGNTVPAYGEVYEAMQRCLHKLQIALINPGPAKR